VSICSSSGLFLLCWYPWLSDSALFFFWCSSIELMLYSFSRMQLGEHSAHQQLYSHGLVIVYVFWQQFVNCLDEILQKYPDDLDKVAELAVSSLQVWYFMIMVLHSILTLEKKEDRCEITMWYKCISQHATRYRFHISWGHLACLNFNPPFSCRGC
jgi:hypothetical protein